MIHTCRNGWNIRTTGTRKWAVNIHWGLMREGGIRCAGRSEIRSLRACSGQVGNDKVWVFPRRSRRRGDRALWCKMLYEWWFLGWLICKVNVFQSQKWILYNKTDSSDHIRAQEASLLLLWCESVEPNALYESVCANSRYAVAHSPCCCLPLTVIPH